MKALNLLVLRCLDLDRSRNFYELFGLSFEQHKHGNGPDHLAHEDERGVFELYPAKAATTSDMTGLGFATTDLARLRQVFEDRRFNPSRDNRQHLGPDVCSA